MKITQIIGREVYDARCWPTVQCEIILDDGSSFIGTAATDIAEKRYASQEVRDGGKRFWGKGVLHAVDIINTVIAAELQGKDPSAPTLDRMLIELDGTDDKSNLGANTLNAVSIALYKAHAYQEQVTLYELFAFLSGVDTVSIPCPQIALFSGINNAHITHTQEFMIAPVGASSFRTAFELCVTVEHKFKSLSHQYSTASEQHNFTNDRQVLNTMVEALSQSESLEEGGCIIALNAASSQHYNTTHDSYIFNNTMMEKNELIAFYDTLTTEYPIYSLEDGFAEDDIQGWCLLSTALSDKIQLVGNSLYAAQLDRIKKAVELGINTTVSIKPSNLGTITETLHVIEQCKRNNINMILANCIGETEDNILADLAVGTSIGQIKMGTFSHVNTLPLCNRLLTIEEHLMYG